MTRCLEGPEERLDKWLWQARFFKSRSLAAKAVQDRRVRVNQEVVTKTHYKVRRGDVLTFAQGSGVRVVQVLDCAGSRMPASVARAIYADLMAPLATVPAAEAALLAAG